LGKDKENNDNVISTTIIPLDLPTSLNTLDELSREKKVDKVFSLGLSNKCERSNGTPPAER
jgi:hypothetical protein